MYFCGEAFVFFVSHFVSFVSQKVWITKCTKNHEGHKVASGFAKI